LHTVFAREHNAICDALATAYPGWGDDELFEHARLINAAVLAKIHTVEWTPALLSNPTLPTLYRTPELAAALSIPTDDALAIIGRAVPRPVTPVYSQLSEILQISLHRALTRQQEPRHALQEAATAMRVLLAKVKLAPSSS
jgi:hypothetical protein